jgi:hypothetical protein
MFAIKKIKNEYGNYELNKNYDAVFIIDPLDNETIAPDTISFDTSIYFCFDPLSLVLPSCKELYYKSLNDRKIVELSLYEKNNKHYSDFRIINELWNSQYSDYKQARSDMKLKLIASGGFNALNIADKKICSEWFIASKDQRDSVYSTNEQIKLGEKYHYYSKLSRQIRLSKALMFLYNILSQEHINSILSLISTLAVNYSDFGIEGTLEGNAEGLFDFIESRVNTSYENIGISSIIGDVSLVMDIFKNGTF